MNIRITLSTIVLSFLVSIFLIQSPALAQTASFQSLLDSGKAQFKRQRGLEKENYTKAYDYLTAAVKDHPGSPEAHYFLGYMFCH